MSRSLTEIRRSSVTQNLVGSIYLAPYFDKSLLPRIFETAQIYNIVDRSPNSNRIVPQSNNIEGHYIISRIICGILDVSPKTIENYFRRHDSPKIGYVVHAHRIIWLNPTDNLSASNFYTLISLKYVRLWYVHSLRIKRLIDEGIAQRWPMLIESIESSETESSD